MAWEVEGGEPAFELVAESSWPREGSGEPWGAAQAEWAAEPVFALVHESSEGAEQAWL